MHPSNKLRGELCALAMGSDLMNELLILSRDNQENLDELYKRLWNALGNLSAANDTILQCIRTIEDLKARR